MVGFAAHSPYPAVAATPLPFGCCSHPQLLLPSLAVSFQAWFFYSWHKLILLLADRAILIMAACAEQTCGFVASPLGFRSLPRSSGRTGAIKMPRISMTKATDDMSSASSRPKVAVVGAGWSGWAAAKALSENDCDVILLDGLPDPSGEKPYLTPTGESGATRPWTLNPNLQNPLRDISHPLGESL